MGATGAPGASAGGSPASGRLVVGGGRAYPENLRPGDVTLDVRMAVRPNVCGDIARAPFRSGTFDEVYFERVPFTAFTGRNLGALDEAARLLRPGDVTLDVRMAARPTVCGDIARAPFRAPVNEIVAGLRAAGFHSVTVIRRGLALAAALRIEAALGGPAP